MESSMPAAVQARRSRVGWGKCPNTPREGGGKELGAALALAGLQHGAGALPSGLWPGFRGAPGGGSQRGATPGPPGLGGAEGTGEGRPQDCRPPRPSPRCFAHGLGTPPPRPSQPRGCPPKASAPQRPGGAESEARPAPLPNRDTAEAAPPTPGTAWAAAGSGNREAATQGAGGTGLPPRPRLPVRGLAQLSPAPTRRYRRVTAAIAHRGGAVSSGGSGGPDPGPPPLTAHDGAAPLPAPPPPAGTHRRATGALPPPCASGFRRGSGSGRCHRDVGAEGGVGGAVSGSASRRGGMKRVVHPAAAILWRRGRRALRLSQGCRGRAERLYFINTTSFFFFFF